MRARLGVALVMVVAACGASRPSGGADAGGEDANAPDAAVVVDSGSPDAMESTDLAEICGGAAPVTLDDWEACYQKRKCEWEVACVSLNTYRDTQDCVDHRDDVEGGQPAADRRDRKRAIDEGRASIDVDAFTQCLIGTSATRCNTALFLPACLTRFTGTVADGGGCYADVECASPDATCQSDCADACCVGTCRPKFRLGEACDLFDSCEPGLRCHGVCLAGDVGTSCADLRDCDFGAWCDLTDHLCKPTRAPGAECGGLLECGGDTSCVGLSIVVSDPGHCVRDSQPGDPCDDLCHGNLYCGAGTCRRLPVLGESCAALVACAGADTMCKNGMCVLRGDVGVACTDSQTCLPGLFCTSTLGDPSPVCAARRAVGEPCADPSHCESLLCSGDKDQPGVCLPWTGCP